MQSDEESFTNRVTFGPQVHRLALTQTVSIKR